MAGNSQKIILSPDLRFVVYTFPLNVALLTLTPFVIIHESISGITGAVISAFIVGTRVFTAVCICFTFVEV